MTSPLQDSPPPPGDEAEVSSEELLRLIMDLRARVVADAELGLAEAEGPPTQPPQRAEQAMDGQTDDVEPVAVDPLDERGPLPLSLVAARAARAFAGQDVGVKLVVAQVGTKHDLGLLGEQHLYPRTDERHAGHQAVPPTTERAKAPQVVVRVLGFAKIFSIQMRHLIRADDQRSRRSRRDGLRLQPR